MTRNYTIDLLRFLAAFWVALYHFNNHITHIENWYTCIVDMGHLGVPIFFVISGYCILLTASKSKDTLDFLTRRLFRIMPTYWFSLIVVLFVVVTQKLITGYNSVTPLPKDLYSIFASITLLTSPYSSISTINWVYWSLTYELFFYFVIAISLYFSVNYKLPFFIFISLLAIVFPNSPHGPLFFLHHWPTFALGLGVYYLYHKHNSIQTILAILLISINIFLLTKSFLLLNETPYYIATIIGASSIMLSHHVKLKNNFFSRLGDYSYAVYLVHVPIGIYLIGMLKSEYIIKNLPLHIAFDLLTYGLVSILSFFIFQYIESPAIKIGRRFSKNGFYYLKPNLYY